MAEAAATACGTSALKLSAFLQHHMHHSTEDTLSSLCNWSATTSRRLSSVQGYGWEEGLRLLRHISQRSRRQHGYHLTSVHSLATGVCSNELVPRIQPPCSEQSVQELILTDSVYLSENVSADSVPMQVEVSSLNFPFLLLTIPCPSCHR